MKIGLIGLGKMGGNMMLRLRQRGIEVVSYDVSPTSSRDVDSVEALAAALPSPRVVWIMVPAGKATDAVLSDAAQTLGAGDLVIDGGNSPYTKAASHAAELSKSGIGFIDVGVSGGIWGPERGYALMAGGSDSDIDRAMPVFEALKPEGNSGFVHAGPVGAGHFVKMVHNGIEYGMMQALGEGYELMSRSDLVPNVDTVVASWQEGTVISSWLLDLLIRATASDPGLASYAPQAADSGEGRWMVEAAVDLGVPVPVTTAALFARLASQHESDAMRVVSALRHEFGGHPVAKD